MSAPLRLQLTCAQCAHASTVDIDVSLTGGPVEEAAWTCGICKTLHRTGVIGRVTSVTPYSLT